MSATEPTATILSIVLGGGAAVMVTTLVNGYRQIRRGHAQAVRENLADAAAARDAAEQRAARALADVDYWRDVAGRRGWQLVGAGIEPYEPHPTPPSERGRGTTEGKG